MSTHPNKSSSPIGALLGLIVLVVMAMTMIHIATSVIPRSPSDFTPVNTSPESIRPPRNPIQDQLTSRTPVARTEGVALVVLIDTSGSMRESVPAQDGQLEPKIAIARRRLADLVQHVEQVASQHPDKTIQLGIYEFSDRSHQAPCRLVVPLSSPNAAAASAAIDSLEPAGGTPIGDAMIQAKGVLDASALNRMHILVITDGRNTQGYDPADVAEAMRLVPEADRAAMYFIAFNVAREIFGRAEDAGVLILTAGNDAELKNTLDYVLTGKILAEQPTSP